MINCKECTAEGHALCSNVYVLWRLVCVNLTSEMKTFGIQIQTCGSSCCDTTFSCCRGIQTVILGCIRYAPLMRQILHNTVATPHCAWMIGVQQKGANIVHDCRTGKIVPSWPVRTNNQSAKSFHVRLPPDQATAAMKLLLGHSEFGLLSSTIVV